MGSEYISSGTIGVCPLLLMPMIPESIKFRASLAGSTLATALRPGIGISANPAAEKPVKLLELYEFEACPFCRLVREALTELDSTH